MKLELDWTRWDGPDFVTRTLKERGHEAWLAGGCVRDLLLEIFPWAIPLKPELGVVLVPRGEPIEVTSFRSEGPYLDGRRPSWVARTTAEGDVQRRDFTVNGLLMDAQTGEVVDHVGGVDDLRAGILRCIRDPRERFGEDHLRLLRAVRFSVRLGFPVEPGTWDALRELSGEVVSLSGERVHEELGKMFGQGPFLSAWRLLREGTLLDALFPELVESWKKPRTEERLEALFARPLPEGLPWVVLLGLGLCPWMGEESAAWPEMGEVALAQEAMLERLRVSNQERDAARLVWKRFPSLLATPRALSQEAAVVRERQFPALLSLAGLWDACFGTGAAARWGEVRRRVETAPRPPAGGVWMAADARLKGARLGEAIRLADAILLDNGVRPTEVLVDDVLGIMFPVG
jgi:tRNA nucleotidyltransferase/poly(A) polymerase